MVPADSTSRWSRRAGAVARSSERGAVLVAGWIVALFAAVVVFGVAFAIGRHHGDARGGRMMDQGRAGGGRFLVLLVVVGLIVTAVVLLVRHFGGRSGPGGAERVLADRFARGEMDEDEYRRRRDALRG